MRTAALVLAAILGLAAGCKSSAKSEPPPQASTYEGEGDPKIQFKDEGGGHQSSGSPSALAYVATPFANIVYLPWKFLGGGFKGMTDGVQAGFAKDRMPIIGVLFSPVNLILGGATGAVEGLALSPGLVGPSDSFGHAMTQPTKHATSIWWYE